MAAKSNILHYISVTIALFLFDFAFTYLSKSISLASLYLLLVLFDKFDLNPSSLVKYVYNALHTLIESVCLYTFTANNAILHNFLVTMQYISVLYIDNVYEDVKFNVFCIFLRK